MDNNKKSQEPRAKSRTLRPFILLLIFLFMPAVSACADKITMKDGKVYEGRITGKSERRYIMALDAGGEEIAVSLFLDDVVKVEMGRESVKRQIPYLKEVEKVKVNTGASKIYEMSLDRKTGSSTLVDPKAITQAEAFNLLSDEERVYADKFDGILRRHENDFVFVEQLYSDLPSATPEDFTKAKQLMDQVYFEINSLKVAAAFKTVHALYLNSIKATFLAFGALEKGLLDEAQRRINESVQGKLRAADVRRKLLGDRWEKVI